MVEFVELTKDLQRPCDMDQRGPREARFHAPYGVGGCSYAFGKVLLRQAPAPARHRNGLAKAVQAARHGQWRWGDGLH
jgi:hypothetical protein